MTYRNCTTGCDMYLSYWFLSTLFNNAVSATVIMADVKIPLNCIEGETYTEGSYFIILRKYPCICQERAREYMTSEDDSLLGYSAITLMMEAVHTPETIYCNETTWCYNPENCHLHTHHCGNLKSHIKTYTGTTGYSENWEDNIKADHRDYVTMLKKTK
jgi:hypothetical protein